MLNKKFRTSIAVFCLLIGTSLGDICPRIDRCQCSEKYLRITCQGIRGRWNIKEAFDKASQFEPIVFKTLQIINTGLHEIPANAIANFKFEEIEIEKNENLEFISPTAFNGTTLHTKVLSIRENLSLKQIDPVTDTSIYDTVKPFKNLQELTIWNHRLDSIPSYAFENFQQLTYLNLFKNEFQAIGSNAFFNVPKLQRLDLASNKYGIDGLQKDSFDGLSNNVRISFADSGISKLEQTIFAKLIAKSSEIVVGTAFGCVNGCYYSPRFDCPSHPWICENVDSYRGKINGMWCDINGNDIFEYCDSIL